MQVINLMNHSDMTKLQRLLKYVISELTFKSLFTYLCILYDDSIITSAHYYSLTLSQFHQGQHLNARDYLTASEYN